MSLTVSLQRRLNNESFKWEKLHQNRGLWSVTSFRIIEWTRLSLFMTSAVSVLHQVSTNIGLSARRIRLKILKIDSLALQFLNNFKQNVFICLSILERNSTDFNPALSDTLKCNRSIGLQFINARWLMTCVSNFYNSKYFFSRTFALLLDFFYSIRWWINIETDNKQFQIRKTTVNIALTYKSSHEPNYTKCDENLSIVR